MTGVKGMKWADAKRENQWKYVKRCEDYAKMTEDMEHYTNPEGW